jgi:cell division protein FtsQ
MTMAAVSAPADKRFRRARVQPVRRRRLIGRYVWRLAKTLTLLVLALYGGWHGTTLILSAPALQVTRITVGGNDRLATGEVLALIGGLQGSNILSASLDQWQQRLLASPWVESASLRRVLPSRIDVEIRERRPMAIARIGGALYLVDPHGVIIDEYGPSHVEFDLPIVDGLAGRPDEALGRVDERRAGLAARVIAALDRPPDLVPRLSQIGGSATPNAVVMLEGDTALLRIGDQEFAARVQEYLDLKPALQEQVAQIDYVDLRFDERVYVKGK